MYLFIINEYIHAIFIQYQYVVKVYNGFQINCEYYHFLNVICLTFPSDTIKIYKMIKKFLNTGPQCVTYIER